MSTLHTASIRVAFDLEHCAWLADQEALRGDNRKGFSMIKSRHGSPSMRERRDTYRFIAARYRYL